MEEDNNFAFDHIAELIDLMQLADWRWSKRARRTVEAPFKFQNRPMIAVITRDVRVTSRIAMSSINMSSENKEIVDYRLRFYEKADWEKHGFSAKQQYEICSSPLYHYFSKLELLHAEAYELAVRKFCKQALPGNMEDPTAIMIKNRPSED